MAESDIAQVFAGYNQHRVDWTHCRKRSTSLAFRYRVDQFVDAGNAFEIRVQAVHEQGIEHIPGNLREARWRAQFGGFFLAGFVTNTDYQNSVGSQVHSRAHRCRLAHCPITIVLIADSLRWEHHRHGDTRHDVINVERRSFSQASRPLPVFEIRRSFEK